jgi:hypothetical protein
MKRKIIITLGMALFVVATMIKLNFSKENNSYNISLDKIAVMAYADEEIDPNYCINKHWHYYSCYHYANCYDCWFETEVTYDGYCDD